MTEPPQIPESPEASPRRGDRPRKPGVGGLPHRVVVEVLTSGVDDEWGPPGYGDRSKPTHVLAGAGLIEVEECDGGLYYHVRRTARGREWLRRFVSPFAVAR